MTERSRNPMTRFDRPSHRDQLSVVAALRRASSSANDVTVRVHEADGYLLAFAHGAKL